VSHVFISYDHQDGDYAHELERELVRRGFEVWIDERIDVGTRWPQALEEQVDACAAFVVVMTPRSRDSSWVQNELARALRKGKPVLPLLLEGEPWLAVEATQYLDVRDGSLPPARFYGRLTQALSGREPPPALLPPSQPFEPEMVLVAAGQFTMGSDPRRDPAAADEEQPQHVLDLPDVYLSRTPVTNAHYRAFVLSTGRRTPGHWPRGRPRHGEHPVVNVSWHDAVAYCRWLSGATGRPYRLPSEAEWEKGARGSAGSIYPWGDGWDPDHCNARQGGGGRPTPVDAYPNGASPYGLLDMAGNVWEWTRSLWGAGWLAPEFRYPYASTDGREDASAGDPISRVVRGGAYDNGPRLVRCAARGRVYPLLASKYVGFRVCVPGEES
jgi:formylglycine-generating enzyme required for sulfatase activity